MRWRMLYNFVALLWLFSTLAIILSSCASTRIVTVPEYHEVVAYQRDTVSLRDSVFVHDSVCITHWGDTLLVREYHTIYRDRWRDRLRVDSFIERDTVTVVKEVEKRQVTAKHPCGLVTWLFTAVLLYFIARILYKRWVK